MDQGTNVFIIILAVVTIAAVIGWGVHQWSRTRKEQRIRGEQPTGGIDDITSKR